MKRILLLMIILTACTPAQQFSTSQPTEIVDLQDKNEYTITAELIQKEINGKTNTMYAYNGMIPGPILKVKQNSTITFHFKNELPEPTTIHWHGVRLENKYDGVPDITQELVNSGETFDYIVNFPDEGAYWYHPHVREDKQQELGLYGNIIVEPTQQNYYQPAREEYLILDDIRLYDGYVESFLEEAHYVLMGRFGNTLLVNGQTDYTLNAKTGETIRLFLTNAANTRMFNFSIEQQELKIIGGDSGLYEKEFYSKSTILAPAERTITEVTFNKPGKYRIMHINPHKKYTLGRIIVTGEETTTKPELRENKQITKSIEELRDHFDKQPDYEIELTMQMGNMMGSHMSTNSEKIEWEDTMEMMNARSTPSMIKWIMKDKKTGKQNEDLEYTVKVGDIKKIRFYNSPESMHPMQHPMHLHGQRFLVLDGKNNYVWKDTVIVPTGESVDILVHFTNPGDWVIHCHIAEHLEAGMMSMFKVEA